MKGILLGSTVADDRQHLILVDGTTLPASRCVCPQCETASPQTAWEDMGSRVRYRLTCPNGHTWEILP